ncbi:glutamine amidotransferase [Schaalia sp. Marseille-Q2122]|uniref:glutamine amidotransferase n=1 Tax=Schaalia sp. Marseille-Q2122 TaxID=2736604 RepID=UPI00158ADBED|nr:glutamine amidotransferase [Schaalia sp. Marseille-Q2122]
MAKVLLAGESWVSDTTDHKGFDPFPHTQVHIGCTEFLAALRAGGHEVTHLRSHDAGSDFPFSVEELNAYDVVILSDIGANTLLLPPEVFEQGLRRPNRLKVLRDWVHAGGGLMMAGGYLSFQGFRAMANYAGTPLEEALPVTIARWDDRVETPEGAHGQLSDITHPITDGLDKQWPYLLGYQKLTPDPDATVLATIEGDPLLAVKEYGSGRSAAYATDISPHWAPREFMEWPGYQQLFCALVSWLARE